MTYPTIFLTLREKFCALFGHKFDARRDLLKTCARCGKWSIA